MICLFKLHSLSFILFKRISCTNNNSYIIGVFINKDLCGQRLKEQCSISKQKKTKYDYQDVVVRKDKALEQMNIAI